MTKYGASVLALAIGLAPMPAFAQEATKPEQAESQNQVGEIIVTAQRRAERANEVPVAISVASGDQLGKLGIVDTADLVKIVPSLNFTPTQTNMPVYTLRGVGFYESALAASPAVSVYVDEVPVAFPAMTTFATLDLARVEVLKGPQGTLYGQNSTGGAVNYISAKPGDELEFGGSVGISRFGQLDMNGYVGGPVTSNLGARLSFTTSQGGAWQRSITRPNDKIGDADQIAGRLLLDWHPGERTNILLNFTAAYDGSETLQGQLVAIQPVVPAFVQPGLEASLLPRNSARLADWDPDKQYKSNNYFYQAAARIDHELSDAVTLTSISAYQRFELDRRNDLDATAFFVLDGIDNGEIDSFSQEVRLAGETSIVKWIVGGNFAAASTDESNNFQNPLQSNGFIIPGLPRFIGANVLSRNKLRTYSIFGNVDVAVTPNLTLTGGIRYTNSRTRFSGCTADTNGSLGFLFSIISSGATGTAVNIPQGGCVTLSSATFLPLTVTGTLTEDNISWRAAANYKFDSGTLVYASAGRGYKSGGFPSVSSAADVQLTPFTQESLMAYEVGLKTPLFGRKAQLNTAAFYYKYDDKQLRGRELILPFGLLERLQNIPRSRVWGIEADLVARPVPGLDVMLGGSYVNSRIQEFTGYSYSADFPGDLAGSPFPNTPRWTAVGDVQYTFPVTNTKDVFVGVSGRYQSENNATFYNDTTLPENPLYSIPEYVTVDIRAGVKANDDAWQLQAWVRNLTNKYHLLGVFRSIDVVYRQPAMPITYGLTLSFKH